MPTFDFECRKCGNRFSEFVSIKDKDNVRCPECNGEVKQLFTGFLFTRKSNASSTGTSCSSCSGGNCSTCGH
ncbi:MAG: zinc ribbon domain-containing protein [Tepidanaerobacter acetatoxydans]|uniref:FmdB family zinc ribbon protein n=1 Tax=Tepidanaerobacter acetatoxydans TaxID=499229 RepID=UPI00020BF197|nr:zinc ribbon domain-containing protein [Tepidanaerobacter acetatoxydans]AEE91212.1 regulatory protein, FmdB family [Tepidanaerobacter acetatoxydans Re1]NLU10503.1 zinc ribbon domain-containing protein [Tepidanaerobacter acetatoxydans]